MIKSYDDDFLQLGTWDNLENISFYEWNSIWKQLIHK